MAVRLPTPHSRLNLLLCCAHNSATCPLKEAETASLYQLPSGLGALPGFHSLMQVVFIKNLPYSGG